MKMPVKPGGWSTVGGAFQTAPEEPTGRKTDQRVERPRRGCRCHTSADAKWPLCSPSPIGGRSAR